jgi:DNA-binding transcriptional LysR family regulator
MGGDEEGVCALHQCHGVPLQPADLAQANCIRFTGNGRSTWLLQDRGREQRITASGNLACNHGMPAIDACVAGLGVGQFLRYQIADHLASGRLKEILSTYSLPPQPISVVYPMQACCRAGSARSCNGQAGTGQDAR